MRPLLIVAAVLAFPAAAQAKPHSDTPITDSIPPPQVIDRGAIMLDRVIDGLLQVDVGPVRDALNPYGRRDRGPTTVGDLARRDDPYFDDNIHRSVGTLADGMIDMSSKMRRLEPVLRQSLLDITRNVQNALRDAPDARDDRRNRDDYGN